MTEQEAEALAKRIERVWELQSPPSTEIKGTESRVFVVRLGGRIGITGTLFMKVVTHPPSDTDLIEIELLHEDIGHGLYVDTDSQIMPSTLSSLFGPPMADDVKEMQQRYGTQWLPFFRRGCWLSGCDIEASAHEKAEWMRGFSREELEAWNLKM